LHITSPCIDRHRCAEATDAAAPLARASLFCGLLASLPLPLHVATTPAVHATTTARVLNAFLPVVHVGTLHSLPATAEWATHRAPHNAFALLAVACGATVLHHTTTRTELPCGRTTSALCLGDFDRGDLVVPALGVHLVLGETREVARSKRLFFTPVLPMLVDGCRVALWNLDR